MKIPERDDLTSKRLRIYVRPFLGDIVVESFLGRLSCKFGSAVSLGTH